MISLTYLSRAISPQGTEQLQALLDVSRARNVEAGVTGMLLYADEKFIQTLEGEAEAVDSTMSRILADPRHCDVDVTLVETLAERNFADWSMGFRILGSHDVAAFRRPNDFLEPDARMYEHAQRLGRAGVFLRVFRDLHPGASDGS